MYVLDFWSISDTSVFNPWLVPELRQPILAGRVHGNPKFLDGEEILTSPITKVRNCDGSLIVTTHTGSEYKLAGIDPRYEELYPD